MELTGSITLDKDTMDELTRSIRGKVVDEIRESGNYGSEIVSYLLDCDYQRYYNMISETINHMMKNVDETSVTWESDKQKLKKLKIIQSIINL